jgi:hypothetical protein
VILDRDLECVRNLVVAVLLNAQRNVGSRCGLVATDRPGYEHADACQHRDTDHTGGDNRPPPAPQPSSHPIILTRSIGRGNGLGRDYG